ncbi:ABC transporter ATP-binding protein [Corynebacterium uterequi]|uniref:Oligopeptide/dipeptide ABC transporter, ATP-binding protein n=1 Tax=Corynebacterium uterequi TaxID=1072256 RepID=A0A0G3HBK5_9CORY|nr:ABC transporter ATP-binding protein [Corynebacterium uterequi]AKK10080.1 oligopeptide/dipeptide ABC transporter, ATP-binding protein [Corynebacterium uterequi]
MTSPILSVRDLDVSFPSEAGTVNAVRGVSFDLYPGKSLAIVGESGSGKSVTATAVMGLLPDYAHVTGSVELGGRQLLGLSDKQMSAIRGKDIGMIFQDPLSALTPVFDIGTQITEALNAHGNVGKKEAEQRAIDLLNLVGIPRAKERLRSFPHEFSGGMRQRVVIAIAIANNPSVLIADEPTTALDVTIQAQILDVIERVQRELGTATIMITHDIGVVAGTADDVMVMYAGRPVESAPVIDLFDNPRMPYTVGLLGSIPSAAKRAAGPLTTIEGAPPLLVNLPDACPFAPRCPIASDECLATEPSPVTVSPGHTAACIKTEQVSRQTLFTQQPAPEGLVERLPREQLAPVLEVAHLTKTFPITKGALVKRKVGELRAVNDVSFDIREGECFAIVGESGSGKTTTLLQIMDLNPAEGSTVILGGRNVAELTKRQRRDARRDIQIVFQDPMGALNPRLTVAEILREPLDSLGYNTYDGSDASLDNAAITARIHELMETVGLDPAHVDRFPGAFSGGQRQRISLARALAAGPKLIVLDEPVSALDVSIQAGILNLLDELKATLGVSFLFVAHDLSVIRHISDRAAVMYRGRLVEIGDTDALFDAPTHPYTKALLAAIPLPDPHVERTRNNTALLAEPGQQAEIDTTVGCAYRRSCAVYQRLSPDEQAACNERVPVLAGPTGVDHRLACHHAELPSAPTN